MIADSPSQWQVFLTASMMYPQTPLSLASPLSVQSSHTWLLTVPCTWQEGTASECWHLFFFFVCLFLLTPLPPNSIYPHGLFFHLLRSWLKHNISRRWSPNSLCKIVSHPSTLLTVYIFILQSMYNSLTYSAFYFYLSHCHSTSTRMEALGRQGFCPFCSLLNVPRTECGIE